MAQPRDAVTRSPSYIVVLALCVGLGGTFGALARWVVGEAVVRVTRADLPYGTLIVNLLGSLVFGLLLGVFERRGLDSSALRATVFTGFLGAFTTFSTFSSDTVGLFRLHGAGLAIFYVGLSVVGGILLAWAGMRLAGA